MSIPACNSAGCKKGSLGKPPSNAAETEKWGKNNEDWMKSYGSKLVQKTSVPACTSLGCNKVSAAIPPTDTVPTTGNWGKMDSDWGINHAANYGNLVQRNSVPACDSTGCKKESMAFPPDTAVTNSGGKMDSDWGINHAKNFADGPVGN